MGETLAALFIPPALFALAVWGILRWSQRYEGNLPASRLGVVLDSELELEAIAPMIGTYHGDEIHEWVRYRGERYDFAYVAPPRYRLRIKPAELYLPPGVVYRKV